LPEGETAKSSELARGLEQVRSGVLLFVLGFLLVYAGAALVPFKIWRWHFAFGIGLTLASVALLVAGAAVLLWGAIRYRRGFEALSSADPLKFRVGSTGALLLLVGTVLIITVIALPVGLLLAWLGIVLSGVALIRLSEEHGSTFLTVSAVLFMVPFLNWLGAILMYFALGEIVARLSSSQRV